MKSITSIDTLDEIKLKVVEGERLSKDDGLALFNTTDLLFLGELANLVKEKITGNSVYFINNRHINQTNVCTARCKLCAFSRDQDSPDAYTMSIDEILEAAQQTVDEDITELHIVGGLHPDLTYDFYLEMLKELSKALPGVHIQAFTAVEIKNFADMTGKTIKKVIEELQEAGLGSLPGGGAEIFSPRVRRVICEKKISGEEWLEVMKNVHQAGMRSNATMLYGHIETLKERVEHLIKLRELQDETGGFQAFIPLAFHPANTGLEDLENTTGFDDLRTLAISRLMLDNFDHIKAFWIMIGLKLAQVSLNFGVDDFDGTIVEERITHAAGAETEQFIKKNNLVSLIKEMGRDPVERDTLYNIIRKY